MSQSFDPHTATHEALIRKVVAQGNELRRITKAHEHNLKEIYRQSEQLRALEQGTKVMQGLFNAYHQAEVKQPFTPQLLAATKAVGHERPQGGMCTTVNMDHMLDATMAMPLLHHLKKHKVKHLVFETHGGEQINVDTGQVRLVELWFK